MAREMTMNMMVVAVVAVMLTKGIAAEKLTVGDDSGWRLPSSPDFYSSWAAKHSFAVGDVLVFNFFTGGHTVAMVTSADAYAKCNTDLDKAPQVFSTAPAEITLSKTGEYFFFCTIPTHCPKGQKFAINVTATATSSTSPSPTTKASPSPIESPPKGSASMAVTSSSFSAFIMALAIALLY